jgi:hypothetical protein
MSSLEKMGNSKIDYHVSKALIYLVKNITESKSHKSTSPRDIIKSVSSNKKFLFILLLFYKKFHVWSKDTQKKKHENLETTFSHNFFVIAERSRFHIIY